MGVEAFFWNSIYAGVKDVQRYCVSCLISFNSDWIKCFHTNERLIKSKIINIFLYHVWNCLTRTAINDNLHTMLIIVKHSMSHYLLKTGKNFKTEKLSMYCTNFLYNLLSNDNPILILPSLFDKGRINLINTWTLANQVHEF